MKAAANKKAVLDKYLKRPSLVDLESLEPGLENQNLEHPLSRKHRMCHKNWKEWYGENVEEEVLQTRKGAGHNLLLSCDMQCDSPCLPSARTRSTRYDNRADSTNPMSDKAIAAAAALHYELFLDEDAPHRYSHDQMDIATLSAKLLEAMKDDLGMEYCKGKEAVDVLKEMGIVHREGSALESGELPPFPYINSDAGALRYLQVTGVFALFMRFLSKEEPSLKDSARPGVFLLDGTGIGKTLLCILTIAYKAHITELMDKNKPLPPLLGAFPIWPTPLLFLLTKSKPSRAVPLVGSY